MRLPNKYRVVVRDCASKLEMDVICAAWTAEDAIVQCRVNLPEGFDANLQVVNLFPFLDDKPTLEDLCERKKPEWVK